MCRVQNVTDATRKLLFPAKIASTTLPYGIIHCQDEQPVELGESKRHCHDPQHATLTLLAGLEVAGHGRMWPRASTRLTRYSACHVHAAAPPAATMPP